MNQRRRASVILLVGDIAFLYAALWLTLTLRYGNAQRGLWELHIIPFSLLFAILLLSFFIAGLYDLRVIAPGRRHLALFVLTFLVGGSVGVFMFYLIPAWKITPRLNLFIHLLLSSLLLLSWHWIISWVLARKTKISVWLFASGTEQKELITFLRDHPQLGYQVVPSAQEAELIVASHDIYQNVALQKKFFQLIPRVRFMTFPAFYEQITGKVPVSLISEVWFLENIAQAEKHFFEAFKRIFDIALALAIGIPALLLFPLIALLIKGESSGPIVIRQKRVGKEGRVFTLIKFRSMVASGPHGLAEENGAQWACEDDKRVTRVGGILRATRLDELPQLWNILTGEMSFVGPRPERPEFVSTLKERLPFYDIRHMVRPGLSGWAQINFPYGASVHDALEKLRYDLYYLKHRSFWLDLAIALKTLKVLVSRTGR
jgi:lipopolysaccharide/colanic/teichoic acid biosynthesis glycosyltransferase